MKKLLLSIILVWGAMPLLFAQSATCEDAPYVASGYDSYLTAGTYWFYSTSYDFPFTINFVYDVEKSAYGKSPEFVVDFSCETGVYEDKTLYEVVKYAKDSLKRDVPAKGSLAMTADYNTSHKFTKSFDDKYRTALYMFGVTDNVPIYIKVTLLQDGWLSFNSSSTHAQCSAAGTDLDFGMTIDLDVPDTMTLYKWPIGEWAHTNYQFMWIPKNGVDELEVAQNGLCVVDRNDDATLDNYHLFMEEYDGTLVWNSNKSLQETKSWKMTEEYLRFYPEGPGQFKVVKLPANITSFALMDSTVFATIDQTNRTITAVLPKGSVPEVAIPAAKIIFEPANQKYSYNADYTQIIIDDGFNSTYDLDITVVPYTANDDATLSGITYDGTPIADFSPNKYEYTINCQTLPTIAATATDPNAFNIEIKQPTDWDRVSTITVSAEDVYTQLTYTVNVILPKHTDATLKTIKANDISISGFKSDVYRYEYNVKTAAEIPLIVGTPNDYRATCENTRVASKKELPDSTIVTCTAEDGSKLDYVVVFDNYLSTDVTLSDLKVNGVTVEGFESTKKSYNIKIGNDNPIIEPVPTHANATYAFNEPNTLGSMIMYWFVVTAEDGETQETYRLFCTIDASADASLKAIYLDGVLIDGFASNVLNYQEERAAMPTITWETNSADAKAEIISNKLGDITNYLITVTAADGKTQQTYSVAIKIKVLSADATLSFISIDGGENAIDGFSPTVYTYLIDVDEVPNHSLVEAEANDPNAKIEIKWSAQQVVFSVTAEDGVTKQDYTVNFNVLIPVEPSHDATLLSLQVNGQTITSFVPGDGANIIDVDFFEPAGVAWTATDANATVTPSWDNKTLTLIITAEDGVTTEKYVFEFVEPQVEPSHDATLISLSVRGESVGYFIAGDEGNMIDLEVNSPDEVTWVAADAATVDTTWNNVTLTLVVTAEDGVTTNKYIFDFLEPIIFEPSHDATLQSITINGTTYTDFNAGGEPNTFTFKSIDDLTYSYQTSDSKATVKETFTGSMLTLEITAEDGVTTERYLFLFKVEKNHDATLAYIVVFGETITDFVPNTPNYISLDQLPTEDDVQVVTTDPNATVVPTWADGSLTLDVTAEDGYTKLRYVFIVNLPVLSEDNSLSDISLDGTTIAGFAPDVYTYYVTVEQLPVVTATANDPTATFTLTQPTEESPEAVITVTAQNGDQQVYIVVFTIEKPVDESLIPLEVVFINGFKGFIDGKKLTIDVYYLSTESQPVGVLSWKPQAGAVINSLDMVSYNTVRVTSESGEALYTVNYHPVQYPTLHSNSTYNFDGTEDYIITNYFYTESRGWRISKDVEELDNRRISYGKDRMYMFLPGCAAIKLLTTTASRSVRIALNGVDITADQKLYNKENAVYFTASQGELTYINGLTKRQPMMLEIESYGSTGDAAFEAITILAEEDPSVGWEDNVMRNVTYADGIIFNPDGLPLSVFSITGQLVAQGEGNIDITAQPKAVYLVRFQGQTLKVIK